MIDVAGEHRRDDKLPTDHKNKSFMECCGAAHIRAARYALITPLQLFCDFNRTEIRWNKRKSAFTWRNIMTINKSPGALLVFAALAVSIVALTASPRASVAKPVSRPVLHDRMVAPRMPMVRPNNPIRDPFASLLLG